MDQTANHIVPPRVVSPITGEIVLLSDEIRCLLQSDTIVRVQICGYGTSCALQHLAEQLRDRAGVLIVDDAHATPEPCQPLLGSLNDSVYRLVIRSGREPAADYVLRLANWQRDDCIEYLLAKHPDQCRSVMQRLLPASFSFAGGSPDVWALILDAMARDAKVSDIMRIVLDELNRRLLQASASKRSPAKSAAIARRKFCDLWLRDAHNLPWDRVFKFVPDRQLWRFLAIADVRNALLAEQVVERLEKRDRRILTHYFLPPIQEAIAELLKSRPELVDHVARAYRCKDQSPTAASLLLLTNRDWTPDNRAHQNLARGYFPNAQWRDCKLEHANCSNVWLKNATLTGCDFTGANLTASNLSQTDCRRARFDRAQARRLDGRSTDFSLSIANMTDFAASDLTAAKFYGCHWCRCSFAEADLSAASFSFATVQACDFRKAKLIETDFTHASMQTSVLSGTDLRSVILNATNFLGANLSDANLEDVSFNGSVLEKANLSRAYLTGSRMRGMNLKGVRLIVAGLAEIDWEDCDLSGADLRNCSFHLGSTRCGRVDSPYPSHGTRTGFYTNDFDDRYFKRPEEIRKASLIGCDLRGANITGVDFYLVDLRGAKYDLEQRNQFEVTGAILS